MKGTLMNLVLMGQRTTGKGGYSIPITIAVLANDEECWLVDRRPGTLVEAIKIRLDRWWLEGRSYT